MDIAGEVGLCFIECALAPKKPLAKDSGGIIGGTGASRFPTHPFLSIDCGIGSEEARPTTFPKIIREHPLRDTKEPCNKGF